MIMYIYILIHNNYVSVCWKYCTTRFSIKKNCCAKDCVALHLLLQLGFLYITLYMLCYMWLAKCTGIYYVFLCINVAHVVEV